MSRPHGRGHDGEGRSLTGVTRPTVIDGVARLAALVAFALLIYTAGYRPAARADRYVNVTSQLANTIRAANDGHPFATYSQREPTRVVRIDAFASGYYDPGMSALISATSLAGRAVVGTQFKLGKATIYRIVFALCLLAGFVFICPALPLSVSVGGLAALAASILIPLGGQNAFTWPRWWPAYSALLVGMLIVGLLTARPSRWRPFYFVGLTILASYSRLLREEVVVTTYAALGGLVATILALWIVARWAVRSPQLAAAFWGLLRRCVLVGTAFCLGLAASPYLLRAAIAAAWDIPFAATTTAVHGAGHSLYLSLGYVPNPYGISWRDNVAMSHSHLIDPTVRVEDPRYQDVLRGEAIRIMLESPWLVRANVIQKMQDSARLLGTSEALRRIAGLAALATVGSLVVFARRRRPELLALLGGLCALSVGAALPGIMIHPSYSFGSQAILMLTAFVVPPAVLAIVRTGAAPRLADLPSDADGRSSRVTDRAVALLGLAALLVTASAGGWYAVRASRYAIESATIAASPNPLADLERDGYRYGRYFNDLPADAQMRLITAMSAAGDSRAAVPIPSTTVHGFRPVLAVYTERQLHIIVWLGKERALVTVPSESAHTFVGFCAACEDVREDLPNDAYALDDAHVRLDVAAIHDRSWVDRYQLLSIPVGPAAPPTGDVRLVLQQVVYDELSAFRLPLKTEGNWRVRFQ